MVREICFGFTMLATEVAPIAMAQLMAPLQVEAHVVLVPGSILAQRALVLAVGLLASCGIGGHWIWGWTITSHPHSLLRKRLPSHTVYGAETSPAWFSAAWRICHMRNSCSFHASFPSGGACCICPWPCSHTGGRSRGGPGRGRSPRTWPRYLEITGSVPASPRRHGYSFGWQPVSTCRDISCLVFRRLLQEGQV